jgi:AcrR family transcriptional regulator
MNKSERTRRHIIEKAAPLFNKKGIAGTSLGDVTAAAGLSKGSIYGNFKSKDELAVAVFQYNTRRLHRYFARGIIRGRTAVEQLLSYPTLFRRLYQAMLPYGGCPVLNTGAEADDTHELLCRLTREFISEWRKTVVELIESGKARGEIRSDADAGKTADLMLSLFEGGGLLSKVTGRDHYIAHAIDHMESLIHRLAADGPETGDAPGTAASPPRGQADP